ncbi:hypothetical protein CFC21_056433, partial [Triticum aestivum]
DSAVRILLPFHTRYNSATPSSPSSPHHHSLPTSLLISPPSPPRLLLDPPPPRACPPARRRGHDSGDGVLRHEEGDQALRGPEVRHLQPPQE